jgi:hypothetical protein
MVFLCNFVAFPKKDYAGFLAPMGGNILLGTLSKFKILTKFPKELEGQRESCLPIEPILSLLAIFWIKKTLRGEEFGVLFFIYIFENSFVLIVNHFDYDFLVFSCFAFNNV